MISWIAPANSPSSEGTLPTAAHSAAISWRTGHKHTSVRGGPASRLGMAETTELPPPCIWIGEHLLEFEEGKLGDEYVERARRELRETPDVAKDAFATIRELIKGEEGFNFPYDDEDFLLQFLRPCKFYPQSAFELMKRFYKFRAKNPQLYDGLMPSKEKNIFLQEILTVLPTRDQHGRRILVIQAGRKWKLKECKLEEIFKGVILMLEIAITEYRTQISGVVVIIDLDGLSLQHVWQFSPSMAKLIVDWVQDCIPLRLKAVHIVNQPYIFNMLFAIFKPFLKEKLRNRIYFHGKDFNSLLEHIDAKCVPTEYGGDMNLPSFNRQRMFELLCSHETRFADRITYGYTKNKG